MKAIHVINPGRHSSLEIGEVSTPEPGPGELLVKIEAAAVNRADLHQRAGKYPAPEGASPILGLEMAGIIEKTGADVTKWKPGDFVFGLLPGGGNAEFCVIHEDMAMPIPDSLSFNEAAAIPETFLTAFQSISWIGKLKRNKTVLIHAGGSGVGTSAIQLARYLFNAQIATTAGKKQKLESCLKLGANFAYNYKKQDFAEEITKDIGKDSVNLVIDFIGAPYWDQNINIMARDGRLVYLSFLGGHKVNEMSLVPILKKRLSVIGSTLRSRSLNYKISLTRDFANQTLDLFEQGVLKPVIDSVYDWSETEEAHQRMQNNENTGKIVLTGM